MAAGTGATDPLPSGRYAPPARPGTVNQGGILTEKIGSDILTRPR
jgi:hypothetical protein